MQDIFKITYRDSTSETVEVTFDALCQFEEKFNKSPLLVSQNVFPAALSWVLHRCLADEGRNTETYEVWRKRIAELEPMDGETNLDPMNPTA